MSEALDQIVFQIQQLFSGRPVWLIILLALVLTVVLRFVLTRLFKLALNILFFILIFVIVLLGLSYLMNGAFSGVPN